MNDGIAQALISLGGLVFFFIAGLTGIICLATNCYRICLREIIKAVNETPFRNEPEIALPSEGGAA